MRVGLVGEQVSPEIANIGSAEPRTFRRRQMRTVKELDTCNGRLPGDVEYDMLGRIDRRKRGTSRRLPKRSRNGEGRTYKSQSDEVVLCLQVGRIGSIKFSFAFAHPDL